MGLKPAEVDELTQRQLAALIRAHNRREQALIRRERLIAYNTAALVADFLGRGFSGKRIPEFDECFGSGEPREMTDEEITRQIMALNDVFGGEIKFEGREEI